jgi:DNA-binding LacI/PurR family transcriptional regulator
VSGCDGLIVIAPAIHEIFELRSLYEADVPFVALLTSFDSTPTDAELPCVDADNLAGAHQAVKHLIELGHERIAIVDLAVSQTDHCDRLSGYLAALSESALTIDSRHLLISAQPWNETVFEGQITKWFNGLIAANCMPTAIFCCDLTMTTQTIKVIQQNGLRIPEDISVVGFDDAPFAALMSPPMTLVRQPVFQMGRRAATKLIDHLQASTGKLSGTEHLPTQLIVRQSTAKPRP